ncbi:hypothetical protein ACHAXR_012467 [Thalassiosira sp. AJA248-18]
MMFSPLYLGLVGTALNRSTPNRSTPPSQRKLFGFEPENVENDKKDSGKKKCKRGRTKEKEAKSTSTVGFSELFTESSALGSQKSLLLGPRLTRRQAPFPFVDSLQEEVEGKSASQLHAPSSKSDGPPAPRLAPKRPCIKKSTMPKLSPRRSDPPRRNDPMSPLHPPRNLRANDLNHLNDFTLTPTVLYNNDETQGYYNHRPPMAPMSSSSQHYHQSPHWSGQVRVNPFSPVPEHYLRPPPTSTKSVSRGTSRKQHPGFYKLMNFEEPTLSMGASELQLLPRQKKARLNPMNMTRNVAASSAAFPMLDEFSEISPTDVTSTKHVFGAPTLGSKRKAKDMTMKPPPQSMDADARQDNIHKRMRIKRGRYLDDFQEVQFLGAGSFGSVNACLSRLDGCMYAVKSISPTGQIKKGNDNTGVNGQGGAEGANYLYGGLKTSSNQCAMPPTPRRDLVIEPLRRKKTMSRFGMNTNESELADDCYDLGVFEGSSHWNDGALRRMLREVFALAALCQQDDFRTFHIVRYQQAWLEDDGTLYIQTELCSATLLDEMSGKVIDGNCVAVNTLQTDPSTTAQATIDVFRQLKVLREVLLALELVHEQGMVHLDIKPENIFLKNNLYKLGDFGLANVFTKKDGKATSTPDIEEGDSRYMSKDLLDFNPKDLTKCDIFSLGATMYQVISGRPLPACGQEWQDLRNGKLPPLPGAMPCLNAIIREMMHPDPDRRPSATDLLSREALRCEDANPLLGTSRKSTSYKVGPAKASSARGLKRSASWSL